MLSFILSKLHLNFSFIAEILDSVGDLRTEGGGGRYDYDKEYYTICRVLGADATVPAVERTSICLKPS